MKDIRLTIVIELHFKQDPTADVIDLAIEGFKHLLSGTTKAGYSKVVDVKMEPLV